MRALRALLVEKYKYLLHTSTKEQILTQKALAGVRLCLQRDLRARVGWAAGAHFTCFTGTKVQKLTCEERAGTRVRNVGRRQRQKY